ncbi:hypothetical protein LPY66_15545 [Dehalobacter sp. DCM]|uniref:hypothetical protein n=1 Tax=Dehalobacter sp. DCM TaxID=2907827 RepID=UPI003081F774|nr:hypothetical protein LPY66_15545 [Dehalobacter sp. DCM]
MEFWRIAGIVKVIRCCVITFISLIHVKEPYVVSNALLAINVFITFYASVSSISGSGCGAVREIIKLLLKI